jgi:hypothetical protein
MDIAVSHDVTRHATRPEPERPGPAIARIEVFDDMRAAEPFWRRLEAGAALLTPYQRFDLLTAWHIPIKSRTYGREARPQTG